MPYGQIAMQPVEQTARPRPVRGTVVEVAVAQKVVRVVDAVVAEHVAMCMQHTLRIPGGARGVHEEQRILGLRRAIRRELRGAIREQVVEIEAVDPLAAEAGRLAAADDHVLQRCDLVAHAVELADRLGLHEDRLGRAVLQPVLNRVGAEELRDRQADRAEAIQRDVHDRGLRPLRRVHGDDVAATDPEAAQRVRHAAARLAHLPERVGRRVALVVFVVERDGIVLVERPVETVERDVVVGRNVPTMARRGVGEALRAADSQFLQSDHGGDDLPRKSLGV